MAQWQNHVHAQLCEVGFGVGCTRTLTQAGIGKPPDSEYVPIEHRAQLDAPAQRTGKGTPQLTTWTFIARQQATSNYATIHGHQLSWTEQ
jgi:hypothetical protein